MEPNPTPMELNTWAAALTQTYHGDETQQRVKICLICLLETYFPQSSALHSELQGSSKTQNTFNQTWIGLSCGFFNLSPSYRFEVGEEAMYCNSEQL